MPVPVLEDVLWGKISGLASGNIWPERLPENPTLPGIVFRAVGGPPLMDQISYLRHPRYRFDVWADTYDDMISISAALRAALDHDSDLHCLFIGETDVPEIGTRLVEATTGTYHRALDFYVWGN